MRRVVLTMLALGLLAGCSEHKHEMGSLEKPKPGPELAKLQRFVGTWTTTAEMVKPTAEQWKKMTGKDMPASLKGENKIDWDTQLGGLYLRSEGWFEVPDGQKANYKAVTTWDRCRKKYLSWYFSDLGEHGKATIKQNKDGNTWTLKGKGVNPHGQKVCIKETVTFLDDNTMEWKFTERGWFYTMKMKGVSKKKS